jgi:phosphate transport system permease protein
MVDSEAKGPKKTRRWVLIADRIADRVISVGGILVIAAVLGIMIFLVYEVVPLFEGGTVQSHSDYALDVKREPILGLSMDEHKTIAACAMKDATVSAWHARTGALLTAPSFGLKGKTVTAFAQSLDTSNMALGFSDGTVRLGRILFFSEVLPAEAMLAGLEKIDDQDSSDGSSIYSTITGKQIRKTSVKLELEDEIQASETGSPIVALDYRYTEFGERPKKRLAAVDSQGLATVVLVESKLNLFTRKMTSDTVKTRLAAIPEGDRISHVLVTGMGDDVYLAQADGKVHRYSMRDFEHPVLAETVGVLPSGVELTVLGFLLGDKSMVVGGSDGSVTIFFLMERKGAASNDGLSLVRTREFKPHSSAVTGFAPSQRGKTFATSDSGGQVWLRHGTSQKTLLRLSSSPDKVSQEAMVLAPQLNGLLAVRSDRRTSYWDIDVPHPEISLHTLFGKVWYEDYPEPTYTWQSAGATDAFEPKVSIVPLIFGTLKGTFYSLLFAIPIALLAAIYTSEFLPYRVRGKVKPVMEVMASLPSVVLGFVAALVLAPVIETWIAAVILVFAVLPLSLILAAYLWQSLPSPVVLRLEGIPKFSLMFVVVAGSMYLAYAAGPVFERLFFAGNFKTWLNGGIGRSTPFLFVLIIPAMGLLVSLLASRIFGYRFTVYLRKIPMPYSALLDFLRWLGIVAATAALSYALAVFLEALGMDPRDGLVGTYVQRNTLIVSFAMGFAVIPIIYTLADDALSAVPDHLRSASLGCGATLWQTAIWIIIPTALSGVFSAVMIGMGRAVGETMIMVMAAGNTPLMDLNVFDGLRALSANIAVEMPEAPKDGSLYRVLFLTGLVLFAMTFVINTVAELVRLHFRKRAMQL